MSRNRIALWSSTGIVVLALGLIVAPWPKAIVAQNKTAGGKKADPENDARPKKVVKTDGEWLKVLSKEQFMVTRKKQAERPGMGINWNIKKDGVFVCVCCKQPLFDSTSKYDATKGYPCFHDLIDDDAITILSDNKKFECSRCDANLGTLIGAGQQGGGGGGGRRGGVVGAAVGSRAGGTTEWQQQRSTGSQRPTRRRRPASPTGLLSLQSVDQVHPACRLR